MMTEGEFVIQFPDEPQDGLLFLEKLETLLREVLPGVHEVDGHDIGSGEMNIFILTRSPDSLLETVLPILTKAGAAFSIGFRRLEDNDYVQLWPNQGGYFTIK